MSALVWWESAPRSELSQGDVLADIPFSVLRIPVIHLKAHTFRGNEAGWAVSATPFLNKAEQKTFALSSITTRPALVLSHDCAIDKKSRSAPVLTAPMALLGTLEPTMQDTVMQQKHFALMPLPGVIGLGDCYADLRLIASIRRDVVDATVRTTSMTEPARVRLHAQLVAFLIQRDMPDTAPRRDPSGGES